MHFAAIPVDIETLEMERQVKYRRHKTEVTATSLGDRGRACSPAIHRLLIALERHAGAGHSDVMNL
jgi:hypothetical protein